MPHALQRSDGPPPSSLLAKAASRAQLPGCTMTSPCCSTNESASFGALVHGRRFVSPDTYRIGTLVRFMTCAGRIL
eukprot:6192423-Pleurochrysis_carterae.AAC.1